MMTDVEEELRELRKFRHDLEGKGVLSIPDRLSKLEQSHHSKAVENARLEYTVSSLSQGLTDVRLSINGLLSEVGKLRHLILGALIAIVLSNLVPSEAVLAITKLWH